MYICTKCAKLTAPTTGRRGKDQLLHAGRAQSGARWGLHLHLGQQHSELLTTPMNQHTLLHTNKTAL